MKRSSLTRSTEHAPLYSQSNTRPTAAPAPPAPAPRPRVNLRLFFVFFAFATLIPSIVGLALTWDGSYTLYLILQSQIVVASYGRLTDLVLRFPVLALSWLTSNPILLQAAFTLPYALIPFLALLGSWWVVRDRAEGLFIWSALGIGIATLPGQACFVCQAIGSVQLFWIILLAILVGMPRRVAPLVVIVAVVLAFFHPLAIPLFAFAAFSAFVLALRSPARRLILFLWTFLFVLATVALELRFTLGNNNYETSQLSLSVVVNSFHTGLAPIALLALLFALLAAVAIWLEPHMRARLTGWRSRIPYALALASLFLAGELLFLWASLPRLWAQAIDFRILGLFTSLPFMLLALGEQLVLGSLSARPAPILLPERLWTHRVRLSQAIAVIFLVVITTLSLVWLDLTRTLQSAMQTAPGPCLSTSSLPRLANTPLHHWALTAYSLDAQGHLPSRIVMLDDGCATQTFSEGLPVAIFGAGDWDLRAYTGGWFDLRALGTELTAQQSLPPSCQYPLTAGWYEIEGNSNNWWRWTSGDSTMRILVAQPTTAALTGVIGSLHQPNQATLSLNGAPLGTIPITESTPQSLLPLTLNLVSGENSLEFKSANPPAMVPGDDRQLALTFSNLHLTSPDGTLLCH